MVLQIKKSTVISLRKAPVSHLKLLTHTVFSLISEPREVRESAAGKRNKSNTGFNCVRYGTTYKDIGFVVGQTGLELS